MCPLLSSGCLLIDRTYELHGAQTWKIRAVSREVNCGSRERRGLHELDYSESDVRAHLSESSWTISPRQLEDL